MSSVSVATLQDTQIRHLSQNLNPDSNTFAHPKTGGMGLPHRLENKPETRTEPKSSISTDSQNPQNINENSGYSAGGTPLGFPPALAKPGQETRTDDHKPGQRVWEVEYGRGFMQVKSTPDQVKQAHDFYENELEKESEDQKKRALNVRGTVFSIMQQREDENGRIQMTQEQWDGLIEALEKDDLLYRSACIWHDKDETEIGELGRLHFHGVVQLKPGVERRRIRQISRLLKVPASRIEVPEFAWSRGRKITTGRNFAELSFFDLVSYLTHETKKAKKDNKYPYPREEVLTNEGFDFNEYLNAGRPDKGSGNKKKSEADILVDKVYHEGMTIKEAKNFFDYATVYNKGDTKARVAQARRDYLEDQPPPPFRLNIYLGGEGDAGKDIIAKEIAYALIPGDWIPGKVEPFFRMGGKNVAFQGYDGEECIIIEEARADILIRKFGRDDLFAFLNPFPGNQAMHIKHSSTVAKNWLTILTGPADGKTFAEQLAGEYTDRDGVKHKAESINQGYRRTPLIVDVKPDSYDIHIDLGRLNKDSDQLGTYEVIKDIHQELQNILTDLKGIEDEIAQAQKHLQWGGEQVAPIVEQAKRLIKTFTGDPITPEEFDAKYRDRGIGKPKPKPKVEEPKPEQVEPPKPELSPEEIVRIEQQLAKLNEEKREKAKQRELEAREKEHETRIRALSWKGFHVVSGSANIAEEIRKPFTKEGRKAIDHE